jgi:AraC-like DNA-binding protein
MRDRQDDYQASGDAGVHRQLHDLLRAVLHEVDGRRRAVVDGSVDPIARARAMLVNGLQLRWSLAELARHVGRSPARLCRLFAERYGEPPMAFLTRRRVEAAVARIVAGSEQVAAIAPDLGYASGDALARAIRRVTGRTVRQLRRS